MKLVLSKSAIKFLEKIPPKDSEKIKAKILYLLDLTENNTPDSFLNEATSLTGYEIDKISN